VNDADRLRRDPAMRWVVGSNAPMGQATSASQMGRFETEWRGRPENLAALADLPGQWIDRCTGGVSRGSSCWTWIRARAQPMASKMAAAISAAITRCWCSTSLAIWNGTRCGPVTCIAGCRGVLEPVIARDRHEAASLFPRQCGLCQLGDLSVPQSRAHALCDPASGQPGLAGQDRMLAQTPGRATAARGAPLFASFSYQAQSWNKPRRVVAKVEWHPGELYPRAGFIVTNLARTAERVVAFYNQRGPSEQWIKEGKVVMKWTRLSCRFFAANAVRLQLHALAYNLGNFMRTLAMPKSEGPWSLTSLCKKLIKVGAKVVSHGRYTLQISRGDGAAADGSRKFCRSSPSCGRHRRQHNERSARKRQGNEGRGASSWRHMTNIGGSAQSIGGFDRLGARGAISPLSEDAQRGHPGPTTTGNPRNVGQSHYQLRLNAIAASYSGILRRIDDPMHEAWHLPIPAQPSLPAYRETCPALRREYSRGQAT
jgi:hypothetical protein